MARAHAAAYRLIHERVPDAFVSWVQHLLTFEPYRPAHAGDRWTAALSDRMFNAPFLELARDGRTWGRPACGIDVPEMKGACDFVGINLYGRRRARFSVRDWRAAFNATPPRRRTRCRGDPGAEEKFGEPCAAGDRRVRGALPAWASRS